jgi:hypothetical protein
MPVKNALPIHRRFTLDEFLAFAGWDITPSMSRGAMAVALDFYQDKVPRQVLLQHVSQPSPWSLPRGNVTKLSELMQAIDFTRPVERVTVHVNERFKCYRSRHEPKTARPQGNWFSKLSAVHGTLAIPGDQDLVRVYVVRIPVECLKSFASDAFTWMRCSQEEIHTETLADKYFAGGGGQYFIWEPERYLLLA